MWLNHSRKHINISRHNCGHLEACKWPNVTNVHKAGLKHHMTISILQTNKTIQTRDYLIDEASENCIRNIILSD